MISQCDQAMMSLMWLRLGSELVGRLVRRLLDRSEGVPGAGLGLQLG